MAVSLKENHGRKTLVDRYVQEQVKAAGDKGIELSTLGNRIYEKFKDFKINDYGYAQFNQYVKSVARVKVEKSGTILIARYKG